MKAWPNNGRSLIDSGGATNTSSFPYHIISYNIISYHPIPNPYKPIPRPVSIIITLSKFLFVARPSLFLNTTVQARHLVGYTEHNGSGKTLGRLYWLG